MLNTSGSWQTTSNSGTNYTWGPLDFKYVLAQSRTINSQNQYTNLAVYDNNGNTTTDDKGRTYTYDAWNRLMTSSVNQEQFLYDALGRRPSASICSGNVLTSTFFTSDWQDVECLTV